MTDYIDMRGHNDPPAGGDFERLLERQAELVATASGWLNEVPEISDQAQADRAAGFIKQCRALAKEADEARKEANRPHDTAIKANNARFQPIVGAAKSVIDHIEPRVAAFLRRERERQQREAAEARRRAEEAARQAREAEALAEEKIRAAERGSLIGTGENTMRAVIDAERAQAEAEEAAEAARALEGQKVKAGSAYQSGGIGKAMSLRERQVPVIADLKKATAFFARKNAPELEEACRKAARRWARAFPGEAIPGVEFRTETKAV